jgi:hypothetical protein
MIGRKAAASLVLCAALAGSLFATRGQAAASVSVRLSAMQTIGPGRLRVDATIEGLEPDLHPTIQLSVALGGRTHEGRPFPVVASHMPYAVDLPTGSVRIGGVRVDEFAAPPPLEENTYLSLQATVRQGDERATATVTDLLLLPTVVVPGYLNDLGGDRMDAAAVSELERRGFSAAGTAPTLFWFNYRSQTLSIEEAAQGLADYVRTVVLPATYASKINLVAYSLGGLIARWDVAFEPGWDRLVNRFVMVGVPNQGAVLSYVDAWYPIGGLARTSAARSLLPTFPFWRATSGAAWTVPPGSRNTVLADLNTHPLPVALRAYAFYADGYPGHAAPRTLAGVTGALPQADVSFGPGDGVVLAASALGLPINGGPGVPGFGDRLVLRVNLGPVRHLSLFTTASARVADALLDRQIGGNAGTHHSGEGKTRTGSDGSGARRHPGSALQDGNP